MFKVFSLKRITRKLSRLKKKGPRRNFSSWTFCLRLLSFNIKRDKNCYLRSKGIGDRKIMMSLFRYHRARGWNPMKRVNLTYIDIFCAFKKMKKVKDENMLLILMFYLFYDVSSGGLFINSVKLTFFQFNFLNTVFHVSTTLLFLTYPQPSLWKCNIKQLTFWWSSKKKTFWYYSRNNKQ